MSFLRQKPSDPLAGVVQGITPEQPPVPDQSVDERLAPDSAPPANMLQNLNTGAQADAAPPQAEQPPRQRRSLLDTVGRLADVFAKVGGADALYQPTLDGREDRQNALGDHARQIDLDKLKLETAQGVLGDAGRARLAQAVRGTQALLAANPQADVSKVFPLLAQRAGLDPAQAASLAGELAQNPGLLDGLAGFDDSSDKFGGSVVYAKGPDGNIVAFQPNLKGGKGRSILPEGFTAIDPLKFVDAGDRQVGVGTRSGETGPTIVKGVRPDTVANNRTAVTIARLPARSKPGAGTATKSTISPESRAAAAETLKELDGIYDKLNEMGALVSPKRSTSGNILSYLRSSGAGQVVEGALGTEAQTLRDRVGSIRPALMQQLAKATGLTGKQLDSNADVKLFMQTVTNPQSSYEANQRAISGLRRLLANPPAPTRALPPRIPPSGGGGKSRTFVYNPKTGKIE